MSGWLVLEVTKLSPHSDRLDVGRRGSRGAAPLGVDKHKTSTLPGWPVPPPQHSLGSKCGAGGKDAEGAKERFLASPRRIWFWLWSA